MWNSTDNASVLDPHCEVVLVALLCCGDLCGLEPPVSLEEKATSNHAKVFRMVILILSGNIFIPKAVVSSRIIMASATGFLINMKMMLTMWHDC